MVGQRQRFLFRAAFCSYIVFTLLLTICPFVFAAQTTTLEAAAVSLGHERIEISVPFSGDSNSDGELLIEWIIAGGDWSSPLGSESVALGTTPCTYTVQDLVNGDTYLIRLTCQDIDGCEGELDVQTIVGLVPDNFLVHNSRTTDSDKWIGRSGWGIKNGKYGEFVCATCHIKGSTNIKRIKEKLVVTDPDSSDQLPIEIDDRDVLFTKTADGASDFGDDTRVPATYSTNICEACHSQTDVHRYDITDQPGGTDHNNKSDCVTCHQHKAGFKASCDGCHGKPPAWNSHPAHTSEERLLLPLDCSHCHAGSPHQSGSSEVSFNSGDPRLAGADYTDSDNTSRYTVSGGYAELPAYTTCNNLYCHSNAAPFDGLDTYANPTWGGASQTCTSCHDQAGAATDLSGRHGRHTDPATYNKDCSNCHAATASDNSTISNNTKHVNLVKDVVFAASGTYNSTTMACDNTYCHSDGRGGAPNRDVAWSDAVPTVCSDCHDGRVGDVSEISTYAHGRLASSAWFRQFPCQTCHYDTTDASNNIKTGTGYVNHVDGTRTVVFNPFYNIDTLPPASYNATTMVCDNVYCHSDGRTQNPEVRAFPWDLAQSAECDSCHGHQGNCEECHSDGRTGWPDGKVWKKATPMYVNTGPGTANANSHVRHMQTDFPCVNCHADTVVNDCSTAACHTGGGNMTEDQHVYREFHINKDVDVVFKDGGDYDPAQKSCSNTKCHTGPVPPRWGMDTSDDELLCLTCHRPDDGDDIDDFTPFNDIRAKISDNRR